MPDAPAGTFALGASSSTQGGTRTQRGEILTHVVVTLPTGREVTLSQNVVIFTFSDSANVSADLDASYPYSWLLEGNAAPQTPSIVLPPPPVLALPTIANYDDAQKINPTQDFTLRWNALAPADTNASLSLLITDQFGKLILKAPNPCVQRPLSASDTSVVIPAYYLRPGLTYNGTLQFAQTFSSQSNDLTGFVGTGVEQRITHFTIGTYGDTGGGPTTPPKFSSIHWLSGFTAQLTLTGPPGQSYRVEKTLSLVNPTWTLLDTVVIGSSGIATYSAGSTTRTPAPAAFFRARSP